MMIYSHKCSTSSSCWAKEASYCMFFLLKTCPNNIADSILAMVTDALASIYVIAPLSMDGSIFITKPANTWECLQVFQHLSTHLLTKKKVLIKLSKKNFTYRQDRKLYYSDSYEQKLYHSDSHEGTSNHNFYNQTKSTNSDNHSASKTDKPVFIKSVISVESKCSSLSRMFSS